MEASGDRIRGAAVTVIGFHHSNTKAAQRILMAPTESGSYRGKLAGAKEGLWEFQITARKGEEGCDYTQTIFLGKTRFN